MKSCPQNVRFIQSEFRIVLLRNRSRFIGMFSCHLLEYLSRISVSCLLAWYFWILYLCRFAYKQRLNPSSLCCSHLPIAFLKTSGNKNDILYWFLLSKTEKTVVQGSLLGWILSSGPQGKCRPETLSLTREFGYHFLLILNFFLKSPRIIPNFQKFRSY